MTDYSKYFDYLRSRSRFGLLYRQLLLYPRLARHVSSCVPNERGYERDPDHKVFYGDANLRRVVSASGLSCGGVFLTSMKSRWLASWQPLYWLYGIFEQS